MTSPHPETSHNADYWRDHGIKIIKGDALDVNTAQTPGMNRAAAITAATAGGAKNLGWDCHHSCGAKTGAHHHGDLESGDLCGAWTRPP